MMALNRRVLPPLLAVGLCGVVLTSWACTSAAAVAPPPPLNGAALEPRVDLPRLTFTRSDGGTFATTETQGRTSLFFFGYTHCADVCPLALAQFVRMRRSLCPDADKVDMYFVTLDPVRDTPERMKVYLTNFPGIVGLVGSDNELASAQSAFSVVAQHDETGNDEYAVDHTAATYLVNSASQIQLVYPYGTAPDEIVADLRRLVAVAPPVGPTVTQARFV